MCASWTNSDWLVQHRRARLSLMRRRLFQPLPLLLAMPPILFFLDVDLLLACSFSITRWRWLTCCLGNARKWESRRLLLRPFWAVKWRWALSW